MFFFSFFFLLAVILNGKIVLESLTRRKDLKERKSNSGKMLDEMKTISWFRIITPNKPAKNEGPFHS